jgi:type II secretory pathway component PulF
MPALTRMERFKISATHRQDWYRAMAMACGDGKSVFVVLERLATEYSRTGHPLAPLLRELIRRMSGAQGGGAAKGARVTIGTDLIGLVPTNEANLIDAGESSGKLENGFMKAADYLQATERLKDEILGPLKEPVFLLFLLLGVLTFFSMQVLPTFEGIAPRDKWPRHAQLYGALADKAIPLTIGAVVLMAFGSWLMIRAAANWIGPRRNLADRYLFPFTLITRVNSAALLTSLSGFVAAGVKFDVALNQLASTSNRYMKTIYGQLKTSMRNAAQPEDALCSLHIMDRGYHWMIRLYGDSSDFAGAMARISEKVIEFTIIRTRGTFVIVNMLLKLLVAGFIIWTMGSLYGIVQAVKSQATAMLVTPSLSSVYVG